MKEANPSSPPADSAPSAKPANISPGMAALLRGEKEPTAEDNHAAEPHKPSPGRAMLKVSLMLADFLLVLLAGCLALRKGSFGFLEISLCVVALVLGAWLTCLAIWVGKNQDEPKR
jgi:hypothetical protein